MSKNDKTRITYLFPNENIRKTFKNEIHVKSNDLGYWLCTPKEKGFIETKISKELYVAFLFESSRNEELKKINE